MMGIMIGLRRTGETWILAGLLAAVLPFWSPTAAAQEPAIPEDPFERVDLEFRATYADGRAAVLARMGPVIVVEMDRLALIRGGQRTEVNAIPRLYHRLKAVSHVPLALYVALAPFGSRAIDEAQANHLRAMKERIAAVMSSLEGSGLNAGQIERCRPLLQRCSSFADRVLSEGKYDPADLQALTRRAGPIVLANAADAARAQIDAYHDQVSRWRREIPADEWARLRVLVLGPQMPRKHNVAVQYFAKLMQLPGESRGLVYAEELSGERQGLNLLATHQLDSELSEAFFGDRQRMEIDLVGNAASVYLDGFDMAR
ncbi:MAG: hypothetical protein U0800_23435 [Isosphaeraceae bacterium]